MIGKGQSLLNMDKAEEALAMFDEALAVVPEDPETLIKKGIALEKLRKLNEAIECYDRAIAAAAASKAALAATCTASRPSAAREAATATPDGVQLSPL